MKTLVYLKKVSFIMLFIFIIFNTSPVAATEISSQKVYDFAGLLTPTEVAELESLSNKYSQKREVDIIILTTNDTQGKDVVQYMEDFYDEKGLGYDKAHGNTAILTLDMQNRESYVAGFYKGEEYLDNSRCDLIQDKITPYLSSGDYYKAFETYIELSYEYMGVKPGVNPENLLFKLWFQVLISLAIAGVIVFIMAYNSGGRVSTGGNTYLDANNSGITNQKDVFVRTTTTKRRKPSNNSNGGGGGRIGGGMTGGGHSHSGSRRSF